MKIDIPDEFIVRLLGFYPDTSVKEAAQKFLSDGDIDRRLITYRLGDYVMHELGKL